MGGELYGKQNYYKGTAKYGGQFSAEVTELTPSESNREFYCIYCVTNTVISSYVGNVTGLEAVTFESGTCIFGRFDSITLTSGSVILYEDLLRN